MLRSQADDSEDNDDVRSLGLAKLAYVRILLTARTGVAEIQDLGADVLPTNIPKFTSLMGSEAEMAAFTPPSTLTERQVDLFEQWLGSG